MDQGNAQASVGAAAAFAPLYSSSAGQDTDPALPPLDGEPPPRALIQVTETFLLPRQRPLNVLRIPGRRNATALCSIDLLYRRRLVDPRRQQRRRHRQDHGADEEADDPERKQAAQHTG